MDRTTTITPVEGTDQKVETTVLSCGCVEDRYTLPGHDDAVKFYPCSPEHDDY